MQLTAVQYVKLPDGYSRKAKPEVKTFRVITIDEVKAWAVPVPETCPYCQGTGNRETPYQFREPNAFFEGDTGKSQPCGACQGTGIYQRNITPTHVWYHMRDGKARRVAINGKVKLWKRDATRVEVSIKYGLYEHARLTADDISMGVLLEEVTHA